MPGRGPEAQLEAGCKITSQLYELIETRDVDAEESSQAAEERLDGWSTRLQRSDHSKEQVAAVLSLEWHVRDSARVYQQEKRASGSTMSLGEWAMRQMATTDFHQIMSFDELEAQVRALSRLAGLSYGEASEKLVQIWTAGSSGWCSQTRSPAATTPEAGATGAAAMPAASGRVAEILSPGRAGGSPPRAEGGGGAGSPGRCMICRQERCAWIATLSCKSRA